MDVCFDHKLKHGKMSMPHTFHTEMLQRVHIYQLGMTLRRARAVGIVTCKVVDNRLVMV